MFIDLDDWRFYLTSPDTSKWIITVLVVFVLIWAYQFIQLMLMSDEEFPGRSDKITWSLVFVIMMPLAPFVFLFWRGAYKEKVRRRNSVVEDEE
jgi:hypothetical protein